ncbi:endonuclease/exonuclease/phosphatase family protein [Epibacterium ulvae]|uniref:endonuclease/exonuclease/phosphatase family protein n=1 Tax=Epibacterium ulvae TaxID=1156985 RepID=UPI001BFC2573|nr:endonuclease/exonuclease/phosphatase family protein [Epibacterium ulvae]MBT8155543.1 endonuclease/exonuclease/phosphatase family protein [Epibacterium ulvae]
MRLTTYNVEWFATLFDRDDALILNGTRSSRFDVTRAEQAAALATVFQAIDSDAVLVVEAPDTGRSRNTIRALEHFASWAGIRARRAAIGFANDTQQEIALLYDPDVLTARHTPRSHASAPQFDGVFELDLDVDEKVDEVRFSKPPLELEITTPGGQTLQLIGAHLKSKAPHGARTDEDVMRISIANRRKQLAQAIWLRRRVAWHLEQGHDLLVMGDLNDGPGLDEYEALFGRSSVEIVMGEELFDPHAQILCQQRPTGLPATARFFDRVRKRFFGALLDYVMISPGLRRHDPQWRIWHPFDDAEIYADTALRTALLQASDHFPVTLDLQIN